MVQPMTRPQFDSQLTPKSAWLLGEPEEVAEKILRHSDVSVTQRYYIKTTPEQNRVAMQKLVTNIVDGAQSQW